MKGRTARSRLLAERPSAPGAPQPIVSAITAFWAWSRFSASS
jgi:hypothetical protein